MTGYRIIKFTLFRSGSVTPVTILILVIPCSGCLPSCPPFILTEVSFKSLFLPYFLGVILPLLTDPIRTKFPPRNDKLFNVSCVRRRGFDEDS